MIDRWYLAFALLACAVPAAAQQDPLAPEPEQESDQDEPVLTTPEPSVPAPPPVARPLVVPKDWRGVFAAIRQGDWPAASAGIAALPDHVLKPVAKAELYTAKNSPKVELGPILQLLTEAPDLPEAEQLQRMAFSRGATEVPGIMRAARMIPLGAAPRRHRSRPVSGDAAADQLRTALEPLVKDNLAPEAEALYQQSAAYLTPEARAEAAQRVAWIYYLLSRDADAKRVAESGIPGATGEWAAHAQWIAGLADWRMNNCGSAANHFRSVAYSNAESELRAAGAFWAARAEQACRRPGNVEAMLKLAARSPESFYGLLARETLGMPKSLPAPSAASSRIESLPNIRRANELSAIGERGLAEQMIRHQARIGNPSDHGALIAKARSMELPATAYWLAHNGPYGARVTAADRFPLPRWQPSGGWRIDPAWAWAHARQESDFRHTAVSPAGAVGLMQVRPGTAGDFARARGTTVGSLSDPATNLEYGQSFIELMRRNAATQGQMIKIIAAYNAGPLPVTRWNYINHRNDPLLWIESLNYWETRYYVPAVLRNLWVYEGLAGTPQTSLHELAQGRWPTFPTYRR